MFQVKKKIIGIVVAASLALTGVVSAASMWGTYKGNEIIRITSNGSALKQSDVPAISYNGRTMVPINMLKDIGIVYTWNQSTKTVDVMSNITPSTSMTTKENITKANMYKYMEDLGENLNSLLNTYRFDSITSSVGGNISGSSTTGLSQNINDYNTFLNRQDVVSYSNESYANKALDDYYKAIDEIKIMESLINTNSFKTNSSASNNFQTHLTLASNYINDGIYQSSQGFMKWIYESGK
ncbi:Copper amine oxidase N-terminal domain-containing protein [Paenibacillus jilunlii]|uniref:Copper amine oxidase N-terminal domain-containing protein n=1 Tax=Paenibacillus jilunlii TaxID=682956 RepID=A0A1H0A3K2_9BACL|nr:Copper amine oxidase N-terminal domain-containing protein [Paenibacillus jilunlii]